MEDCHILSPHSPHGQWFRDFSLRGCLVSEDSCYICMWRGFDHLGIYFHGSSFTIDQSMSKKKKSALSVLVCFIEFMCQREFV